MKINKVDSFLFSPVNPKNIIVFRVLVAIMIAYMFAPKGLDPIYPLTNFPDLSFYIFSDAYYLLIYSLILLFAIGLKPQIIAFILFIVLLPHDFLSEGRKSKQVILCVLLCFIFIRSLPIWKVKQKSFQITEIGPIWPIRLIQIQLTLLYGVNALAKTNFHYLGGESLINMSIAYENFHVNFSDGYFHLGKMQIPIFLLAISSVLMEYFLAVGLWFKKTKWIAVIIGIAFHFSLALILSIYMLDYISLFLYLSFIIPFKLKNVRVI